jgi:DNA-binding PadR family transcriptional regulator
MASVDRSLLPLLGSGGILTDNVQGKSRKIKLDNRARADLELFILGLIEHGLTTPYDFLSRGGISQGASMPVLGRLEEGGYIKRGKSGARGRIEYKITTAGLQRLKGEWRSLLDAPESADVEAMLRIATLGLMCGAEKTMVAEYLRKGAKAKSQESRIRKADAATASAELSTTADGQLYRWMRATHTAARFAADARTLQKLAAKLKQLKLP